MNIKDLKHEFKMSCDGDAWGNCMDYAFALCDVLIDMGYQPPDYWKFKQGVGGTDSEAFGYEVLAMYNIDELLYFSKILYHYKNYLERKGKSY